MENKLGVAFELKALNEREFDGHGAIFRNVDFGGDVIAPGAFTATLAEHKELGTWPPMYWMHQKDQVPGVWHEIREDSRGLYVRGELVETQLGNEVRVLLQKKAVRGLSIGYRATDYAYDREGIRQIKTARLGEVSIVSMSMNPLAQISQVKTRLASDGAYVQTKREFEEFLRSQGYSRKFAEHAIAKLFGDASFQGEPEEDRGEPDGEPGLSDVLSAATSAADATERALLLKTLQPLMEQNRK